MDFRIPTIAIVDPENPDDFVVINRSDFKPSIHEEFKSDSAAALKNLLNPPDDGAPNWDPSKVVPNDVYQKLKRANYIRPQDVIEATTDRLMDLQMGRQLVDRLKESAHEFLQRESERIEAIERLAAAQSKSKGAEAEGTGEGEDPAGKPKGKPTAKSPKAGAK